MNLININAMRIESELKDLMRDSLNLRSEKLKIDANGDKDDEQ